MENTNETPRERFRSHLEKSMQLSELAEKEKLTPTDVRIIWYLGSREEKTPISVGTLAQKLGLVPSTASTSVTKLWAKGKGSVQKYLIPNDAQAHYVEITDEGRKIYQRLEDCFKI